MQPVLMCLLITWCAAPAAQAYDSERDAGAITLKTADIVSPDVVRGRGYTLPDHVPVVDGRCRFLLRTRHGEIPALGREMLQVRISELPAIERAKAMAEESQELEGAKESLKQTGRGLKSLFTDPGDALMSIPKGIGRKVKSLTDENTRRAGGDTRRKLAVAIGCDPETENPVLDDLLDKLSLRRKIGSGLVSAVGFAATGGAATVVQGASALRTTAQMQETLRTTPIYKINERIEEELAGASIPKETREAFIDHRAFTTLQRMLFMEQFRRLRRITGAARLIGHATAARDQSDALALIRVTSLLADVHARTPLVEILGGPGPGARRADGHVIVIDSADYVIDTPGFKSRVSALAASHQDAPITFVAGGRVAAPAAEFLQSGGITVIEDARIDELR